MTPARDPKQRKLLNLVVRVFREKKDGGEETEEGEKKGHFMDASQTATAWHAGSHFETFPGRRRKLAPGSFQETILKHFQADTENSLQEPSRSHFEVFPGRRRKLAPGGF